MNISMRFVAASIVGSCLFAFFVGYFYGPFVFDHLGLPQAVYVAIKNCSLKQILSSVTCVSSHFDATTFESLHPQQIQWNQYLGKSIHSIETEVPLSYNPQNNGFSETDKRISSDAQQVLIDLKNLDSVFLDSENMVGTALLKFIEKLGINMLTYECHRRLSGKGVSCTGYSGHDFISLHTRPSLGLLSLTVFNNVPVSVVSVIQLASEIFAFPTADPKFISKEPSLTWTLNQRGVNKLHWMKHEPVRPNPLREYDTNSIGSYEITSSNIDGLNFKPLFAPRPEIKNNIREHRYNVVYPEALVHPAMFAHDDPKRVAVIGNGTGVVLREVLKHETVEKVVLFGPDSNFIQQSKTSSPQLSDCSNFEGSSRCCYDDARVEIISPDTLEWLLEEEEDDDDDDSDIFEGQFDVVIFEKSDNLWSSQVNLERIFDNLSGMLSDDGVLAIPHGVLESSIERKIIEALVTVGFEAVHRYDEFFQSSPLSFIVCFHNQESRALWFASAAEYHVRIQSRLVGTVSDDVPILHWFDEATMMNYQFPSRLVEDAFCSQPEKPFMCDEGHGFDPEVPNAPISSFGVGRSLVPGAGRGIFFQTDVAKGTLIAAEESVYAILVYPTTTSLIHEMMEFLKPSEYLYYSSLFHTYLFGYGFAFEYFGEPGYLVDTGILTFINHGCNGTQVMGEGEPLTSTELTVDPEHMPPELENYGTECHVYNPFIDRNNMRIITSGDKTLFDMKKGSELLDNYLRYLHEGNWKSGVLDYRAQCVASAKGVVTGYEERKVTVNE